MAGLDTRCLIDIAALETHFGNAFAKLPACQNACRVGIVDAQCRMGSRGAQTPRQRRRNGSPDQCRTPAIDDDPLPAVR